MSRNKFHMRREAEVSAWHGFIGAHIDMVMIEHKRHLERLGLIDVAIADEKTNKAARAAAILAQAGSE